MYVCMDGNMYAWMDSSGPLAAGDVSYERRKFNTRMVHSNFCFFVGYMRLKHACM